MFKLKTYKVLNCTLYGDNNKIFKNNDIFVLDKDIKILDTQLESLIKDKKIVYIKNKNDTEDNLILKNLTIENVIKNENKIKKKK